ncbi:MAG: FTR1 family protein [Propionibacteriales bacterium]|nr:FTR1 family protein [Propionibacteriales bacterium]
MLANILIGLREGLEASLVVCILVAYMVKTGRSDRLSWVWIGVGAAVVLSFAVGALLQFTSSNMSFEAREAFGGVMSILSVCLVTWMIFWMRRSARFLKADLEGKLAQAMSVGALALTTIAFVSVGREGLETSIFVWSAAQATSGTRPLLGVVIGLTVAVGLGYLIYRSALKINLAKFFTYTGFALVLVAAGVLAYGFHDLQEAGWIPGLGNTIFDVSATIPGSSGVGEISYTLLKGAFNFNPEPTYVEFIVWITYLVAILTALLWPRRAAPGSASTAPTRTSVDA